MFYKLWQEQRRQRGGDYLWTWSKQIGQFSSDYGSEADAAQQQEPGRRQTTAVQRRGRLVIAERTNVAWRMHGGHFTETPRRSRTAPIPSSSQLSFNASIKVSMSSTGCRWPSGFSSRLRLLHSTASVASVQLISKMYALQWSRPQSSKGSVSEDGNEISDASEATALWRYTNLIIIIIIIKWEHNAI